MDDDKKQENETKIEGSSVLLHEMRKMIRTLDRQLEEMNNKQKGGEENQTQMNSD